MLSKQKSLEILAPIAIGLIVLTVWEVGVRVTQTPVYLLLGPLTIFKTLIQDSPVLLPALGTTFKITICAFLAATISGLGIAMVMAQSSWLEKSLYPYVIVLQTVPLAAIAPLIIIWLRSNTFLALVVCAWIAALFPIISNTLVGLSSAASNLRDLFKLYQASPWQTLIYLRLPSALPYFLAGLRISGGLALIGAVVAEFVAGSGGANSGIAYQILIAGYNLEIPKMFAALLLVTLLGIVIFFSLASFSQFLLKDWHESAQKQP
ncbi:MAG: ABC transporter permease [Microcystaceae cyanobacterium]